jgi:predicted nucleic acid-binding protein
VIETASVGDIYFDTSLLTTAVFRPIVHHEAAERFSQDVLLSGRSVYISELIWLEYAHALRSMSSNIDEATQREYHLHRWDLAHVRSRWVNHGVALLRAFLARFDTYEVPFERHIVDDAIEIMVSCNLSSYDAAHVATALSLGITELAAVDSHFERASHLLTVHTVRTPTEAS